MVQRSKGAGALTNPELEISPSVFGTGGSDSDAVFLQALEINGTRQSRAKIAKLLAQLAQHETEQAERGIALETTKAYWRLRQSIDLLRLSNENLSYSEQLQKAVQRQVDVGTAPGARLIRASMELIQAQQIVDKARAEAGMARASLNVLMGRKPDSPIDSLVGFKDRQPIEGDSMADFQRIEVKDALTRIELAKLEAAAVSLRMRPDVSFQVRKGADTDDIGFAVVASVPIFDWGGNRSEKKAAKQDIEACIKDLEAIKAQVALEISQADTKLNAAKQVVRDYENGLLDKARKVAELSRKGFDSGATSYLEVLEAQATLREVEAAYIAALADLCSAEAELAWARGVKQL